MLIVNDLLRGHCKLFLAWQNMFLFCRADLPELSTCEEHKVSAGPFRDAAPKARQSGAHQFGYHTVLGVAARVNRC